MKNIHILPTDQPSRLVKIKDTFFITSSVDIPGGTFYNIYITSSEKIKQGDWYLDTFKNEIRKAQLNLSNDKYKKIILSTDPTLIPDGVQVIDDEFLKWFVRNPSCEFVEVNKKLVEFPLTFKMMYKIIIPQEEAKQDLEKAAEKYSQGWGENDDVKSFKAGAKWQAERMYSEEDMRKSFFQGWVTRERFDDQIPDIIYPKGLDYEEKQEYAFNLWLEQFKKK